MEWAHNAGVAPPGFPEAQGVSLRGLYAVAHALQMEELISWCIERVTPTLDDMSPRKLAQWWGMARALPTEGEPLAAACGASWLRRVATADADDAADLAAALRRAFGFEATPRPGQEALRDAAAAELAAVLRKPMTAKLSAVLQPQPQV